MTTLLKSSVCFWNPRVSPLLFVRHIFWGLLPRSPGGIFIFLWGKFQIAPWNISGTWFHVFIFFCWLIYLCFYLLDIFPWFWFFQKSPLRDGIWHISISWFIRMSYLPILLVNLPRSPPLFGGLTSPSVDASAVASLRDVKWKTIHEPPKKWGNFDVDQLTHRVSQKLLDKSARDLILANSGAAFGASNLIFGWSNDNSCGWMRNLQ